MPLVKIINEDINIEVESGTILLDVIRDANIKIETPCNTMGFCGKCKVIAKGSLSQPSHEERKFIDENKNERLSCVAVILGDTDVELLNNEKELQTINKGFSIDVSIDSPVKNIKLPSIIKESSLPYLDYLGYRFDSLELYRKLSLIEEDNPGELWGVVFEDRLLDISDNEKDPLGLAIDIGTTSISYYLIELSTGEIVEELSSLNPQTQYGGDVLTRITYCMENPGGNLKLQELIVDEINNSIKEMLGSLYIKDHIYHIMISANTTMVHLLLGISPISLAKSPYRPIFSNLEDLKAKDIAIYVNDEAIVSIIPAASSYVGGDIVSGIMSSDFKSNDDALFIDIGTNGEMAVLKNGKIISTSTAAGPALEGMNIEWGCRAEKGAIDKFHIDEDFNISYTTIGHEKPIGICGSGLIDIAAALLERNIILKSGRWNKDLDPKVKERLVDKKFYITEDIYISQKDIRQIQLAKGAIAAGVILMLEEIDLKIENISKVYIAGSFGYHVNPHNIKAIGLIPKGFKGEIVFLGNSSLEGARLALINRECFRNLYKIKNDMEVIELSLKENFQDVFISQLNF